MPYQKNPTIINNQKPVNIFYVWYAELCRRLNSSPAPVVKPAKPKCQTVLNFVADRLKVDEWSPVISALRHDTSLHVIAIKSRLGNCQFLHEVDTEDKLRQMKRRSGTLWTAFILKSLLKSLSCTVRNTQVLTCLEFDGLPMFSQYLEPLLKALQKNKTLKNLSLSRCRICDEGCQLICAYVRFAANIEVLNLSACCLTSQSGEHIAKLIKYQQINRYCESWHNSLRYSDPNIQVMRGIKRITLNGNPLIGDNGLEFILNELDDDLWIKALDMQKCGITENIAMRIIDLVEYSQSLEIADFRLNDDLLVTTIEKILNILKQKQLSGQPEYQWCNTSFTITTCGSVFDTVSTYTSIKTSSVYKAKSVPLKQVSKMSFNEKPLRKARTSDNITAKNKREQDIERRVMELNNLLQEEIARRKETEKVNEELKRQLNEISKIEVHAQNNKKQDSSPIDMLNVICKKNGVKKKNGIKNGVTTNNKYHHEKNGFKMNGEAACEILNKLVSKEVGDDGSLDEASLLDYVQDSGQNKESELLNGCDLTDSQISLFKFMENLKNNNANLPVTTINRPNTSRYYIYNKHVKKKM